jgi:hypothetical protein
MLNSKHKVSPPLRAVNWSFEVFLCFIDAFVVSLIHLADYFFEKINFIPFIKSRLNDLYNFKPVAKSRRANKPLLRLGFPGLRFSQKGFQPGGGHFLDCEILRPFKTAFVFLLGKMGLP